MTEFSIRVGYNNYSYIVQVFAIYFAQIMWKFVTSKNTESPIMSIVTLSSQESSQIIFLFIDNEIYNQNLLYTFTVW